MNMKVTIMSLALMAGLAGCASMPPHEPPRDVSSVSSKNSKTIFPPKIARSVADGFADGFRITYAQMAMGFDTLGCNAYRNISTSELNQCAKLPEDVKAMAISYCENKGKKAVFWGNEDNWIKMTVSKFSCEAKDA